jgi:hypothetical protein
MWVLDELLAHEGRYWHGAAQVGAVYRRRVRYLNVL